MQTRGTAITLDRARRGIYCAFRANLALSLDHIARRDSTQQNCFVELNRVGRCDHFIDSTRPNSFAELSRVAGDVITLKTQPTFFGRIFVQSVLVVEF